MHQLCFVWLRHDLVRFLPTLLPAQKSLETQYLSGLTVSIEESAKAGKF